MGGSEGMEGVSVGDGGGGAAGGEDCNDGGTTGGGFGGGLGCESGQGGGAGSVGQYPGDPERAGELGKELDKSIGDFDESIGEEQREIASTTRNTEGFDTGSGGNRGGSISLGEQAAGAMSGGSGGGGGAAGSDAASEAGAVGGLAGLDEQEVARRTPDDIEAIIDDDIVAKQLREAALAEEDPELRERLWAEYRKYKGL
jgi:hypothetical protein